MKKVTKEQLDTIMHRWMMFADFIDIRPTHKNYLRLEQSFLYGAFTEILDCSVKGITTDQVPPIVFACWMANRPVTTIGNWEQTDTRLATASDTMGGGR